MNKKDKLILVKDYLMEMDNQENKYVAFTAYNSTVVVWGSIIFLLTLLHWSLSAVLLGVMLIETIKLFREIDNDTTST